MKARFWLTALLFIALVGSLTVNYLLYARSRDYYSQLNLVRLDPLELNLYPSETAPENLLVFYGDSRAASWPEPIPEDAAGLTFANRGIRAQTTGQILQRFDYHVAPLQPEFVLIQAGINDLKMLSLFPDGREWILLNMEENLRALVNKSTDIGAKVILTTIFPVSDVPLQRRLFWTDEVGTSVREVNAMLRTLAGDDVLIFDSFNLLADASGKLRPEYAEDELHLNSTGYTLLNRELATILPISH